jgi:hypothetical protein
MTRMLPAPVHVRQLYDSCRQSPYVATFHRVINRVKWIHCSQEKGTPDYIPSTPTGRSVGFHPIYLPLISIEAIGGKAKHLLTTSYIDLLGSYLQHVISTFKTCSQGSTHRSLTDMDEGYNLGGVGFPHYYPPPFSTDGPPLSPKVRLVLD